MPGGQPDKRNITLSFVAHVFDARGLTRRNESEHQTCPVGECLPACGQPGVRLPPLSLKVNGPADSVPAGHHPRAKPRLLLVEDDPVLRRLLGEILGAEYDLTMSADGVCAWEAAQEGRFDLVLSDVEMPGLDGIELTRRLRAQAHTAAVPILLLSANNRPAVIIQALEANADDYLLKPFRPQELLARTRHRLRLCEMRRAILAAAPVA